MTQCCDWNSIDWFRGFFKLNPTKWTNGLKSSFDPFKHGELKNN